MTNAGHEHDGILYFYSESIGFATNGVCALIAACLNFGLGGEEEGEGD